MNPVREKWIAYTQPNPNARVRLFCFPFAGGGASTYRKWQESLPEKIDVCPVQLPGRETRITEPPVSDINVLISTLCEVLQQYFDIPVVFFGHSMGALISFELAHALNGASQSLVHLFVSAYQSPPRPNKNPPISHLPDDGFLEGLRRFEFTPEGVLQHRELVELLLPVLRADFSLYERYIYKDQGVLATPITAFGGSDDDLADMEDLQAWRVHTSNFGGVRMIPGGHFYLQESREGLLQVIEAELQSFL